MTHDEFQRRAKMTRMRGRSLNAAYSVLVDGLSQREASRGVGIDVAAVSRAVKKLTNITTCKTCGQVVK